MCVCQVVHLLIRPNVKRLTQHRLTCSCCLFTQLTVVVTRKHTVTWCSYFLLAHALLSLLIRSRAITVGMLGAV